MVGAAVLYTAQIIHFGLTFLLLLLGSPVFGDDTADSSSYLVPGGEGTAIPLGCVASSRNAFSGRYLVSPSEWKPLSGTGEDLLATSSSISSEARRRRRRSSGSTGSSDTIITTHELVSQHITLSQLGMLDSPHQGHFGAGFCMYSGSDDADEEGGGQSTTTSLGEAREIERLWLLPSGIARSLTEIDVKKLFNLTDTQISSVLQEEGVTGASLSASSSLSKQYPFTWSNGSSLDIYPSSASKDTFRSLVHDTVNPSLWLIPDRLHSIVRFDLTRRAYTDVIDFGDFYPASSASDFSGKLFGGAIFNSRDSSLWLTPDVVDVFTKIRTDVLELRFSSERAAGKDVRVQLTDLLQNENITKHNVDGLHRPVRKYPVVLDPDQSGGDDGVWQANFVTESAFDEDTQTIWMCPGISDKLLSFDVANPTAAPKLFFTPFEVVSSSSQIKYSGLIFVPPQYLFLIPKASSSIVMYETEGASSSTSSPSSLNYTVYDDYPAGGVIQSQFYDPTTRTLKEDLFHHGSWDGYRLWCFPTRILTRFFVSLEPVSGVIVEHSNANGQVLPFDPDIPPSSGWYSGMVVCKQGNFYFAPKGPFLVRVKTGWKAGTPLPAKRLGVFRSEPTTTPAPDALDSSQPKPSSSTTTILVVGGIVVAITITIATVVVVFVYFRRKKRPTPYDDENQGEDGKKRKKRRQYLAAGDDDEGGEGQHQQLKQISTLQSSSLDLAEKGQSSSLDLDDRTQKKKIQPTARTFRKGRKVGSGGFGTVFMGIDEESGMIIAAKEISLANASDPLKTLTSLLEEISKMGSLSHPNVVEFYGSDRVSSTEFCIFMEYLPGGSLRSQINDTGRLPPRVASKFTRQALEGLKYLHGRNLVHRDIKAANMLLDITGVLKLSDLGSAADLSPNEGNGFHGTAHWMAPEVLRGGINKSRRNSSATAVTAGSSVDSSRSDLSNSPSSSSTKNVKQLATAVDIWSLGCTVYEMLTGRIPFEHISTSPFPVMRTVSRGGDELEAAIRKECPGFRVGTPGYDFVLACLQYDPSDRPSAIDLLGGGGGTSEPHPFLLLEAADFSGQERWDDEEENATENQLLSSDVPQVSTVNFSTMGSDDIGRQQGGAQHALSSISSTAVGEGSNNKKQQQQQYLGITGDLPCCNLLTSEEYSSAGAGAVGGDSMNPTVVPPALSDDEAIGGATGVLPDMSEFESEIITTGEIGALTTTDPPLAENL